MESTPDMNLSSASMSKGIEMSKFNESFIPIEKEFACGFFAKNFSAFSAAKSAAFSALKLGCRCFLDAYFFSVGLNSGNSRRASGANMLERLCEKLLKAASFPFSLAKFSASFESPSGYIEIEANPCA